MAVRFQVLTAMFMKIFGHEAISFVNIGFSYKCLDTEDGGYNIFRKLGKCLIVELDLHK